MRSELADKYNLITIQCDYFGYEFMQECLEDVTIENLDLAKLNISTIAEEVSKIYHDNNINTDEFINSNLRYKNEIVLKSNLNENMENFNDIGIMKALDNIVATLKHLQ